MRIRNGIVFNTLVALSLSATCIHAQQTPQEKSVPSIEDLGNQRYRIGNIEIDKATSRISMPGRVLRDEPPIEFLVASRGGYKSYESVLEADASALEFNLACILIGLDSTGASTRESERGVPWQGDPVDIAVSWEVDGKTVSAPGASLLTTGNPPAGVVQDDWIYVESIMLPNGEYLPESIGTLVGLVQLGESVIEYRTGMAVGNYGGIGINTDLLPPVGSSIRLQISKPLPTPADKQTGD